MHHTLFSQDYHVSIPKQPDLPLHLLNVIRDKNNSLFRTEQPCAEVQLELKFKETLVHSLSLRNSGSPGLQITLVNSTQRTFFHLVPDMLLLRNEQLFLQPLENQTYRFELAMVDPIKSKIKYDKILVTLKNPFHQEFPRRLGLFYFIIMTQHNHPLQDILSLQKPKQSLHKQPTSKQSSIKKTDNKASSPPKSNKKDASEIFQQRHKRNLFLTSPKKQPAQQGRKSVDFQFMAQPYKESSDNPLQEVELIVEGLDDVSDQNESCHQLTSNSKKQGMLTHQKEKTDLEKAIEASLVSHKKEQDERESRPFESDMEYAVEMSLRRKRKEEQQEQAQLEEAIRRSMLPQQTNIYASSSEEDFQPIVPGESNHSGKIFFTEEQKYERFSH